MCPKNSRPELLLNVNSLEDLIVAKLAKVKKIIINRSNISPTNLKELIFACKQLNLNYFILTHTKKDKFYFLSSLENNLNLKKGKFYILPAYLNLDEIKNICQDFPLLRFGYIIQGKLCSLFFSYLCQQKTPTCANFGLNILSKKLLKIENLKGWVVDSLGLSAAELFYQLKFYQQIIDRPSQEKLALKILEQGRVRKSSPYWFLPQSPKALFLDLKDTLPFLGEVKGKHSRFLRPRKELFAGEKIIILSQKGKKHFIKVPKYIPAKGKLNLPLKIEAQSKCYLFLNLEEPLLKSLKKIKLQLSQTYKPVQNLPADTSSQCF